MKTEEAIAICETWFSHIEDERKRCVEMQRLAAMSRSGQGEEARRLMAKLDRTPRVYDGARLEPAVRHLVALGRASGNKRDSRE